jgi:hypothetical protein
MKSLATAALTLSLIGCANMTPEQRAAMGRFGHALMMGGQPQQQQAYRQQVYDYEWDWDQFWNGGQRVWVCRGVQTGEFADFERCRFVPQYDHRWTNN